MPVTSDTTDTSDAIVTSVTYHSFVQGQNSDYLT